MKVRGARGWEDKKVRVETYLCHRGRPSKGEGVARGLPLDLLSVPPWQGSVTPTQGGNTKGVPPGSKCPPQGHTTFSVLPPVKLKSSPWGTRTNWTNGARPSQNRAAASFRPTRTQLRSQQGSPGPLSRNLLTLITSQE